ncbi:MAG: DUF429 domain-containing protein [Candidatus Anammoximicrobium sp.]|nr:DUF429 domain-containing protein [Candidatus Anammoximicrobium sp.]
MLVKHIIGVDLTDPYARSPRKVDVAVLDAATGTVRFDDFQWTSHNPQDAWSLLSPFTGDHAIVVIDGPQALAARGASCRVVERELRAPGRTPDELPEPRSRPFAGYIRGSIEFFKVLLKIPPQRVQLARPGEVYSGGVLLLEAFPGAAWPKLAGARLPSKATSRGRDARAELLRDAGLTLPGGRLTHDRLDAAICALLGWWYVSRCDAVELVGSEVFSDDNQERREGQILQPKVPVEKWPREEYIAPRKAGLLHKSEKVPVVEEKGGEQQAVPNNVAPCLRCDWVYFATPARADQVGTYELAAQEGLIARTLFQDCKDPMKWQSISRTQKLAPQQTVLLCYGEEGRYRPLARCRIDAPDQPVTATNAATGREWRFPACCFVENELAEWLMHLGYPNDPRLGHYTAIVVDVEEDLQNRDLQIVRPKGQDAILPWGLVFP